MASAAHAIRTLVRRQLAGLLIALTCGIAPAQSQRGSTVTENRDLSALAVHWLQSRYGGNAEVSLSTPHGIRRVDLLTQGVASEVKVGNQSLTSGIREQIRKDRALLSEGTVRGVAWHFMSNPTNDDAQYVSEPLLRELYASDFGVYFHGDWYEPPRAPAPSYESQRRSSRSQYGSNYGEYGTDGNSRGYDSGGSCCRVCTSGQACGNSCISSSYTCRQPPGCACDGR